VHDEQEMLKRRKAEGRGVRIIERLPMDLVRDLNRPGIAGGRFVKVTRPFLWCREWHTNVRYFIFTYQRMSAKGQNR